MFQYASRLRRAISISSFLSHHPTTPPLNPPPSRFLTSTITSTSSPQSFSDHKNNEACESSPDTILFEGCDFNHWLIVIDFPKHPIKPSSQEMRKCYEQTAAKIFGSLEEAKKRIYACSTTIYTGFQVECSVETSEKFKDLPEVTYVLPDSYIDAVSKEYGGDKYIDGLIIPRPSAFKHGRLVPCGDWKSRPCVRGQTEAKSPNYGSRGTHPSSQNSVQPPQRSHGPPQQSYGSQSRRIYGGQVHSQGSRRD